MSRSIRGRWLNMSRHWAAWRWRIFRLPAGSSDQPETEPFPKMTKCHSDVGFLDWVSTTVMPPADATAKKAQGARCLAGFMFFYFPKNQVGCGLTKDLWMSHLGRDWVYQIYYISDCWFEASLIYIIYILRCDVDDPTCLRLCVRWVESTIQKLLCFLSQPGVQGLGF